MAKEYSSTDDVLDPVIRAVSEDEDHEKAALAIERELRYRGVDPAIITSDDTLEFLKELSVSYACMRRCKYSMKTTGDPYELRLSTYEKEWRDGLRNMTLSSLLERTAEEAPISGIKLGSIELERA